MILNTQPPSLKAFISLREYCAVNSVIPATPESGETEIRELSNLKSSRALILLLFSIGTLTVSVRGVAEEVVLNEHSNSTSISYSRLSLGIISFYLVRSIPFKI
jgi:hypothetical protein